MVQHSGCVRLGKQASAPLKSDSKIASLAVMDRSVPNALKQKA